MAVMNHRQSRFLGERPYGHLQMYARTLDVAILPIATLNVAELQEKDPFLRLVDNSQELAKQLTQLRGTDFRDGLEGARIQASREETWDVRAQVMLSGMEQAVCGLEVGRTGV